MEAGFVDQRGEQFDIDMNNLTVETKDSSTNFLEFAANNDVDRFKHCIEHDLSGIDEVGSWYGRNKKGSKQMVLDHRTPLMVAATYGSIDVMKLILSFSSVDVNQTCGLDKLTALHCAASGGSENAVEVVKLLLEAGADSNLIDANGHFPVDVILVSPKLPYVKFMLEDLLRVSKTTSSSSPNSPPLSSSPDNRSVSSSSDSNSSPKSPKYNDVLISSPVEKKEYPIDPSLPDIKNGIYSTDEFRMFSFKIRPCSRAYSHDWTECPFVHPGENARRRDPRKFHYSCVPCPDFRKGACRRGDMCQYAHGVFECWLHPAQYRTRLCKDGTNCYRRVCFFAHKQEELRPLFVSTGSAVPSPRSSDFNLMPPSPFTPPVSPSSNGISNMGCFQSSRLQSSFNARDILVEDLDLLSDYDVQQQQLLNELSRLREPGISSLSSYPPSREELFSAESSSPRYSDQALLASSAVFSPTHKSAVFNQFHNTNFSPKNIDHPLLQGSFGVQSPGRMSSRIVDPISPMSSRVPMQQEFRSLSSHDLGSNSAAIVGQNSDSWAKWRSSNGKPDWTVNADECGRLRRSSFELGNNGGGEEPDLSWVQSLVKESPQEVKENPEKMVSGTGIGSSGKGLDLNSEIEPIDQSVLGAWLQKMQLDQLYIAQ
ncbi:zinc finger CCCH domain-containing protein 30-like [Rhododendron vialii]|uniref:zinc finger CCCH domain-containing protein 30-like n=1 Tax=Rhododendron vialii TaxID=182163 RepID=UPI00265FE3C7|nr:zinc finger CCCH domain-containing protein 30-like [Rhododendron vialii]XP_058205268.1 zinc finger CCCH domain-containing protein 30-like [Rhododendron vialii]XP_058205269.1 zinc finger CCCH domain-containing protein 30-like [Rhododendron vialii]